MEDVHTSGSVQGTAGGYDVGGVVGRTGGAGVVADSSSSARVSGPLGVGGLVGGAFDLTVRESSASGRVTGGNSAGGLVGFAQNTSIADSFATGAVSGQVNVGGLVGAVRTARLQHTYSVGPVSGLQYVGGLVGGSDGRSTESSSYFASDTSGQVASALGSGRTKTQLTESATYAQWRFGVDRQQAVWGICRKLNEGLPFLLRNVDPGVCFEVPEQPQSVAVEPSVGAVVISWEVPLGNPWQAPTAYTIEVFSMEVGGSPLRVLETENVSVEISDLVPAVTYYVDVRSRNRAGRSEPLPSRIMAVPLAAPPGPVQSLRAQIKGNSLVASWLPPLGLSKAEVLRYEWRLRGGAWAATKRTEVRVRQVAQGRQWWLEVRAVTRDGIGPTVRVKVN